MLRPVDHAPDTLSIREVSERSGCSASALRYYEDEGLITALPRGSTSARRYKASVLKALDVITALRGVGFGISEIKGLISAKQSDEDLAARLERVLGIVQGFQATLQERRESLERAEALLAEWERDLLEVRESLPATDRTMP